MRENGGGKGQHHRDLPYDVGLRGGTRGGGETLEKGVYRREV